MNQGAKVFYIVMIAIYAQFIVRTISHQPLELIMNILGAVCLFLYVLILIDHLRGRYVQSERLLLVLAVVTLCQWVPMMIYEIVLRGHADYVILNSGLQMFLIEWIILTRYRTIKRLEKIARGGRS